MMPVSLATAKATAIGGAIVASLSAAATFVQAIGGSEFVPLLIGSVSIGGVFASGGAFFVLRQQATSAHLRVDKHADRLDKIAEAVARIEVRLAGMDGYRAGSEDMATTLVDRLAERFATAVDQQRRN